MRAKSAGAPVRVALLGASGRMGQAILQLARDYPEVKISAALVRMRSAFAGTALCGIICSTDVRAALLECDVLLDFSNPASTAVATDVCIGAGKPLVTGVTGLDKATHAKLAAASKHIPVLAAANMSLGANLLLALTRITAVALGPDFDLEITDIHHRGKRDAPSGTALALGEAAAAARGLNFEECAEFGRRPDSGPRRSGSIGFAAVRAGDAAGEHRVLFGGPGESLELIHRAESRAAFARGALAAAGWIAGRPAGLYGMAEVLNLAGG